MADSRTLDTMAKATFDPGLTEQYSARLRRAINRDGTFNVQRFGASRRDNHPYLYLVQAPWPTFFALLCLGYLGVNLVFAAAYVALGADSLQGGNEPPTMVGRMLTAFYFSSHTLTTVGFGSISPRTSAANLLAAVEALAGLLSFAVATGLLFGRVSRPSARIGFSEQALIAPYRDGTSLQFRIVNRRKNTLMDLEVTVLMMTVMEGEDGPRRDYKVLKLERDKVYFFPLTWTVVHPIDEGSPLNNIGMQDLERSQTEFLVLVKAWDETFSQTVHQRYSYRYNEIIWNARFTPAFSVDKDGDMELHVDRVGGYRAL